MQNSETEDRNQSADIPYLIYNPRESARPSIPSSWIASYFPDGLEREMEQHPPLLAWRTRGDVGKGT